MRTFKKCIHSNFLKLSRLPSNQKRDDRHNPRFLYCKRRPRELSILNNF